MKRRYALIKWIAITVAVLLIGWYLTHIWTDCLQEHSVFTCMKMLNK